MFKMNLILSFSNISFMKKIIHCTWGFTFFMKLMVWNLFSTLHMRHFLKVKLRNFFLFLQRGVTFYYTINWFQSAFWRSFNKIYGKNFACNLKLPIFHTKKFPPSESSFIWHIKHELDVHYMNDIKWHMKLKNFIRK